MSNCVNVHNNIVSLGPDDINIPRFREACEKANEIKRSEDLPEGDGDTYIHWWFLSRNVEFHNRVVIRFGECRSSHTWRDLRHTINTLNKYMKRSRLHTFELEDKRMEYYGRHVIDLSLPAEF